MGVGEYGIIVVKHNWSVSVGGWRFGILEPYPNADEWVPRPTEIHLGPTSFGTNLAAFEVLGIAAIGVLLLVAGVALVISRAGRNKTP